MRKELSAREWKIIANSLSKEKDEQRTEITRLKAELAQAVKINADNFRLATEYGKAVRQQAAALEVLARKSTWAVAE